MEREKKKNKKVGERREKQQSINYLNQMYLLIQPQDILKLFLSLISPVIFPS